MLGWGVLEGLPTTGAFEMREGDTRGDSERPGTEDGRLAQEWELAEDLDRCFLEDVVGEFGSGEAGDVAAQRGVGFAEELLEGSPVAGLGEQDQERLAGRFRLLRVSLGVHA